jgi:hypothetical protein
VYRYFFVTKNWILVPEHASANMFKSRHPIKMERYHSGVPLYRFFDRIIGILENAL